MDNPNGCRLVQSILTSTCASDQFWKAMDIFITRSYIINRRLIGEDILGSVALLNDKHLEQLKSSIFCTENLKIVEEIIRNEKNISLHDKLHKRSAVVKKLLPKRSKSPSNIFEIIVIGK